MIAFPKTRDEATAQAGEVRAGGTDLQERRHLGLAKGPLRDLRDLAGLDELRLDGGRLRIGARVTVAQLAASELVRAHYPGLALAAGSLATPQIRAVATVGGNLLQRVRCWYFRHPQLRCFKSGGDSCPARAGDHLFHVCFDQGPCIAPHPSTVGMALTAYEAEVEVAGPSARSPIAIGALYGDGSDPRHEHTLGAQDLLTAVVLPPPVAGERGAYFRAIGRAFAEWPLVEVTALLWLDGGRIVRARVAMGGVANTPLRLHAVEAALLGHAADAATLAAAAAHATDGAKPLPMTAYKLQVIPGAVLETLERAVAAAPSGTQA
jgi:xanthine dehydrogenase YagS FAD-binding subunit